MVMLYYFSHEHDAWIAWLLQMLHLVKQWFITNNCEVALVCNLVVQSIINILALANTRPNLDFI